MRDLTLGVVRGRSIASQVPDRRFAPSGMTGIERRPNPSASSLAHEARATLTVIPHEGRPYTSITVIPHAGSVATGDAGPVLFLAQSAQATSQVPDRRSAPSGMTGIERRPNPSAPPRTQAQRPAAHTHGGSPGKGVCAIPGTSGQHYRKNQPCSMHENFSPR
jgi:hypothetical protein